MQATLNYTGRMKSFVVFLLVLHYCFSSTEHWVEFCSPDGSMQPHVLLLQNTNQSLMFGPFPLNPLWLQLFIWNLTLRFGIIKENLICSQKSTDGLISSVKSILSDIVRVNMSFRNTLVALTLGRPAYCNIYEEEYWLTVHCVPIYCSG